MAQAHGYGIKSTILRLFNVYGGDPKLGKEVISIFINRGLRGEPLVVKGPEKYRDFVHIEDVAEAFSKSVTGNNNNSITMNIGTGTRTTLKQLALMVNSRFPNSKIVVEMSADDGTGLNANVGVAKEALEFSARSPKTGIPKHIKKYAGEAHKEIRGTGRQERSMMTRVPFAKPFFEAKDLDEILDSMRNVLTSGWLTSGKNVETLERQFAESVGTKEAVAVNSCTAALHASLLALDIKYGDEVIVPSDTFVATANAVLYVGATPIFADSDPNTFNISSTDVQQKISKRTKAIIAVHLGGNPCDMRDLSEIAQDHRLSLLEDCAHAHGAKFQGRNCGTFGVAKEALEFSARSPKTGIQKHIKKYAGQDGKKDL